jgi:predicted O-linked N-acetylglucosamine transferase (SPINDLY family)
MLPRGLSVKDNGVNRKQRRAAGRQPQSFSGPVREAASPAADVHRLMSTGFAHHQAGRLAEAAPFYDEALRLDSGCVEALHLAGVLAAQMGRPDRAVTLLARLLRLKPAFPEALYDYGNVLSAIGRLDDAVAAYGDALRLRPAYPEALTNLGLALRRQGRLDDAIARYRQALQLQPADPTTLYNLGGALCDQGNLDEAIACYGEAVRLKPDFSEALAGLGSLVMARNNFDMAEAAFSRVLQLAPRHRDAARGVATIYRMDGRADDAVGLASRTDDPIARFLAGTTIPAILPDGAAIPGIRAGYLSALAAAGDASVEDPLEAVRALGHFFFTYYDIPLREIHELTAASYRRICPSLAFTAPHCRDGRPAPRRRPRVVFVSANLHGSHTVSRLFSGLISGLASRPFDVIAAVASNREDDAIERLRRSVSGLLRLPKSLPQARRILAECEADVLVYLDIGMEPFTYFLASSRLAPLQLVTWGHPVTPGLDTINGFLSADHLDPPGAEADHTEPLHRLPAPAFVFERPGVVGRDRSHFGLPDQAALYVCPQTLMKLHPDFDALVGAILRADRSGRLVLLAGPQPAWRRGLEERFARTMPDVADRVVFLPNQSREDFLGLLGAADVMLDIPSYSGGNTTLEALAAGLPVVTLPGGHFKDRMTAGLLDMAGLSQGIADTTDDYVRLALAHAHDGTAYRADIAGQAAMLYGRRQAVDDFEAMLTTLIFK